ncbi:MAG TPA: hypothetical protein VJP76_01070 [Candidatus Tumulicola sp.]|nr:hypothetical protein [Candidatus Tumulicola sp.]
MNAAPAPFTFVRAMREDRGRFAALSDSRVLIYWPHGLGDWAHLGAIVPLLEPSNAYAATRFGDDYAAILEGRPEIAVLPSGTLAVGDGQDQGAKHLGLSLRRLRGAPARALLPAQLSANVRAFAPDALLWTDYPETEGRTAYPFHTKARNLARSLVRSERLREFDLSAPLPNLIDFAPPPPTQRWVDERLAAFAPAGTKLCVVSRTGFTAARKNWGDDTAAARRFAELLRRDDARWRVLTMDDEPLGGAAAGFRELFGASDEPFARLYKALAARTDLFVGVPAGPLHVTMARGGIPVVGLWLAHHPDWYDEPNPDAIHLVGSYVRERRFDRRPATVTKPPSLRHRLSYLDSREVPAAAVFEAARQLL